MPGSSLEESEGVFAVTGAEAEVFNFEVEHLRMRTFGCDARTDCWMVGYGIGYMGWILDMFNFEVENLRMRTFGCDGCLMVGYLDRAPCYISWMVGYMGWIWDRLWDGWIYGPAEAYWLDGWIYRLDIWDGCGKDCGMIGYKGSGDLASRSSDEPNTLAPSKVKVGVT